MKSLPTTDSAWLDEVRHAFADASQAQPFPAIGGNKPDPTLFVPVASKLCANYRGLPVSGPSFDRAMGMARASYLANFANCAEIFAYPEVAFAFCYVTSHLGYGLISESETSRILDYLMDHADILVISAAPRPAKRKSRAPAKVPPRLDELIGLTGGFCKAHLNEEYEELCARLVRKAGRKRTPPFATGQVASWAAGVVHAICTINFAFDKSQTPHLSSSCIAEYFAVSPNTAGQKSKTLRDLFRLTYWDAEFSTQEMQQRNPMRLLRIL